MEYSHPKKRHQFFDPGNYQTANRIDSNIILQFDKSCYNDFNIYTSHEPCNHKLTLAGFVHRNSNVGKVFGSLGWAFYFFNPGPAEKSAKMAIRDHPPEQRFCLHLSPELWMGCEMGSSGDNIISSPCSTFLKIGTRTLAPGRPDDWLNEIT